jgi:prepilin-type N-terminal cleavage/methylation domain-containing protein
VLSIGKTFFKGFTLVEVLISLLILAEIATFTIPKLIIGQQNATYKAKAKEVAGMVAAAYQQYQFKNSPVPSTAGIQDLTPYMNYVSTDSSTVIDNVQDAGFNTCGSGSADFCLRLHNGAIFRYGRSITYNFGGTSPTDKTWFVMDPDGTSDGTTNGPGKAVAFYLYYNGRISSYGVANNSNQDPPWFTW